MRYRLGCPVFGARSWLGEVIPPSTPVARQLAEYARIFDAVEGNGSFYGLPSEATVARWAEDTPEDFRFTFKLPKTISHERALLDCEPLVDVFAALFRPLGPRMGPSMLQLPPQAGREAFGRLHRFLARWPADLPLGVEVRHRDWFDDGRHERDLHRLLLDHGAERVCLDSGALFAQPADDEATAGARSRKPRVPVRRVGLGKQPVLRFIGRNRPEPCQPFIDAWVPVVARWMREGREPLIFCHAPDERYAPWLARSFHDALRVEVPELPELPSWPLPEHREDGQLSLL